MLSIRRTLKEYGRRRTSTVRLSFAVCKVLLMMMMMMMMMGGRMSREKCDDEHHHHTRHFEMTSDGPTVR
jgi:hypothetical protein